MRIYFTTVVRRVPVAQGGAIVCLDWEAGRLLHEQPLMPADPDVLDLNPRGGARGGRGVLRLDNDHLLAASYHTLHIFDRELHEVDRFSHNLFVGLHEMCPDPASPGRVWVAATAIDAALCVDVQRREVIDEVWPRESASQLRDTLGLATLGIERSIDNRALWLDTRHNDDPSHTHLNAMCVIDGELHIGLNRFGAVWNATRDAIVVRDPALEGMHNLRARGNEIIINDTRGKAVRFFDRATGEPTRSIELLSFPELSRIDAAATDAEPKARSLFVRGMDLSADGSRLFIGFSPATIAEFDAETGSLVDLVQHSTRARECVHGVLAWED